VLYFLEEQNVNNCKKIGLEELSIWSPGEITGESISRNNFTIQFMSCDSRGTFTENSAVSLADDSTKICLENKIDMSQVDTDSLVDEYVVDCPTWASEIPSYCMYPMYVS
jgi:hypothetical protein